MAQLLPACKVYCEGLTPIRKALARKLPLPFQQLS
jgi:hypothetical protein